MLYFKVINDLVSMLSKVCSNAEWEHQQIVLTCLRQIKSYLTTPEAKAFATAFAQSEHLNPVTAIASLCLTLEEKEQINKKAEKERRRLETRKKTEAARQAKLEGRSTPTNSTVFYQELSSAISNVVSANNQSQGDYSSRQYEVSYSQDTQYYNNEDDDSDGERGQLSNSEDEQEETIYDNDGNVVQTIEVNTIPNSLFSLKKRPGDSPNKSNYDRYHPQKYAYFPADLPINNPRPNERKIGQKRWPENVDYICIYCRAITPNIRQLKNHLRYHDHAACSCRTCRREFPNPELAIAFHLCPKNHNCTVCGKEFNGDYKLEKHMLTHRNVNEPRVLKISCIHCEELFSDIRSAVLHVGDFHGENMWCDSCLKQVISEHDLADSSPLRIFCLDCAHGIPPGTEPEESVAASNPGVKITDLNKKPQRKMFNNPRTPTEKRWAPDDMEIKNPHPLEMTREDKKKDFTCVYCRQILPDLKRYKQHLDHKHKFDNCPECKLCGSRFGNPESLSYHVCKKDTICEFCGKTFRCNSKLRRHYITHRMSKITITCSTCDDQFESAIDCLKHNNTEHLITDFVCDSCGESCDIANFSPQCSSYRVYCTSCQTKTTDDEEPGEMSKYDSAHSNVCMKIKEDKVPVSERARDYPRSGQYQVKIFECTECGVKCKGKYEYSKHQQSIKHLSKTKTEVDWVSCAVCYKTFISQFRLDRHILRNHPHTIPQKERKNRAAELPVYTCGICQSVIQTEQGYMNHIKSHLGMREYLCEVCGAAFNTAPALANHRTGVHKRTGPPPDYSAFTGQITPEVQQTITEQLEKCWYCIRRFSKRKTLLKHMSRCHTAEYTRDKSMKLKTSAAAVRSATEKRKADDDNITEIHFKHIPISTETSPMKTLITSTPALPTNYTEPAVKIIKTSNTQSITRGSTTLDETPISTTATSEHSVANEVTVEQPSTDSQIVVSQRDVTKVDTVMEYEVVTVPAPQEETNPTPPETIVTVEEFTGDQVVYKKLKGGSSRGEDILIDNRGYIYNLQKVRGVNDYNTWRCLERSCYCKVLELHQRYHGRGEHTHDGDQLATRKRAIVAKIKQEEDRVFKLDSKQLYDEVVAELGIAEESHEGHLRLLSHNALINARGRFKGKHPEATLEHLSVPLRLLDPTTVKRLHGASQNGADILCTEGGYMFTIFRVKDPLMNTTWRCGKRSCRARVYEVLGEYQQKGEHNHEGDPTLMEKRTLNTVVKSLVLKNPEVNLRRMVAQVMEEYGASTDINAEDLISAARRAKNAKTAGKQSPTFKHQQPKAEIQSQQDGYQPMEVARTEIVDQGWYATAGGGPIYEDTDTDSSDTSSSSDDDTTDSDSSDSSDGEIIEGIYQLSTSDRPSQTTAKKPAEEPDNQTAREPVNQAAREPANQPASEVSRFEKLSHLSSSQAMFPSRISAGAPQLFLSRPRTQIPQQLFSTSQPALKRISNHAYLTPKDPNSTGEGAVESKKSLKKMPKTPVSVAKPIDTVNTYKRLKGFSQNGSDMLSSSDGYLHTIHKVLDEERVNWRCSKRSCSSRIRQRNGEYTREAEHNHPGDLPFIQKRTLAVLVKNQAMTESHISAKLLVDEILAENPTIPTSKADRTNLYKIAYRWQ